MPVPVSTLGRRTFLALVGYSVAAPFAITASAAKRKKRRKLIRDARCLGGLSAQGFSTTPADRRFAQVFEARRTGKLVRADIAVDKAVGSTGDWIVRIVAVGVDGAPTDEVLAEATIPDASVPAGNALVRATFSPPAPVRESKEYGLVVTRPTSTGFAVMSRSDNPCGGRMWASFPGDAYLPTTQRDMIYTTYHKP